MNTINWSGLEAAYGLTEGLKEKADELGYTYYFTETIGAAGNGYFSVFSCLSSKETDDVIKYHQDFHNADDFDIEAFISHIENIHHFLEEDYKGYEEQMAEIRKAYGL